MLELQCMNYRKQSQLSMKCIQVPVNKKKQFIINKSMHIKLNGVMKDYICI